MTPRGLQDRMVAALDDFDRTQLQAAIEALRRAVMDHNLLAESLRAHYEAFPEPATRAAVAKHPVFKSVVACLQDRIGRRELY